MHRSTATYISRYMVIIFLLGALCTSAGCGYLTSTVSSFSVAPVVPPRGHLFFHYKAPLVLPGDAELGGQGKTKNNKVIYVKIPRVNVDFALGHADIEHAARKAGIKTLVYADYEYLNILGLFKSLTVHAYGYPEE